MNKGNQCCSGCQHHTQWVSGNPLMTRGPEAFSWYQMWAPKLFPFYSYPKEDRLMFDFLTQYSKPLYNPFLKAIFK